MAQFMLALYDVPADYAKYTPEQMQKMVEKYMAWAKRPSYVQGKRLAGDAGRVLRSKDGKARATDGPYSETKEVLAGFYIIEAADYDEAVAQSLDHPHLEFGGTIEVRAIWAM